MTTERRKLFLLLAVVLAAGLVWRCILTGRFYGWEESDYGNLAMAQGVLASGFTRYDMNHMPLYYGLSGLVLAVVGDAVVATRMVSMAGGLLALGLVAVLGWRLYGWWGALLAVAWVFFQPEFALYSASALREPLYAGLFMLCLCLAGRERLWGAALAAGAAFLVRFDAFFILGPLLFGHAAVRPPRAGRLLAVSVPTTAVVGAWSLYCWWVHGTWRFWEHSVAVNLETGGGNEAIGAGEWVQNGLHVVWGLLTGTLPGHLGWLLLLMGLPGLLALLRGDGVRRLVGAATVLTTGFWLLTGFIGQHEPGHNLYWKWLMPLVPLWGVAAAEGSILLMVRLRPLGAARGLLLGVALLATWAAQLKETGRQIDRSKELYYPQLALAREIERSIPEHVPLILDNIPACWLNRRPHGRTLWSWMDIPVEPASREALGRWLLANGVGYVLWFQEDWTQAPVIAPWLAAGGVQDLGGLTLEEQEREDSYGWIWYRVVPQAVDALGAHG